MAEKKEYRSAIRSRKLIRQAFIELLKEKKLEKITVTDIVKQADINRSTFYAHYPDVMGVVDEIQEEILIYTEEFMETVNFKDFFEDPRPYIQKIMKLTEENQEFYRLLYNKSGIVIRKMDDMREILVERTIKTIEIRDKDKRLLELEFSIRFFMGGVTDIYTQWLSGKFDCSLEEITDQLAGFIIKIGNEFI